LEYEIFWYSNKLDLQDGHNPRQVSGSHLCAEIYDANKIIYESCRSDTKNCSRRQVSSQSQPSLRTIFNISLLLNFFKKRSEMASMFSFLPLMH
jgi:hypothetical protein